MQAYFEENPRDLKTLRHDKALHTVKLQEHLSHVPDYLIPKSLKSVIRNDRNAGDRKKKNNKDRSRLFREERIKCKMKTTSIFIVQACRTFNEVSIIV